MPFFKVLGGRWGEGHEVGDIIELDTDASLRRLDLGEIELEATSHAGKVEEEAGKE